MIREELFGFTALLYMIICIGLPLCKLSGVINISWGLVLCPLWIPIVLIYAAIILVFVGMLINK